MESEFEPLRIHIDPRDIHHALYYATMYIGDSQTMAAEAAVLGTPSVRYNDFVGRLGYLEELEHKFELTFGIPTGASNLLTSRVRELLAFSDVKKEWLSRRNKMLEETIDVAAFWTWLLEGYPKTAAEIGCGDNLTTDSLRFYLLRKVEKDTFSCYSNPLFVIWIRSIYEEAN